MDPTHLNLDSRRTFLARSAQTGAALSTLALASQWPVHASSGDGTLKLGLIGCGGRGAGAVNQAMKADDGVVLHSMCDVSRETLTKAHELISKGKPERVAVPEERRHVDFEGYQRVIEAGRVAKEKGLKVAVGLQRRHQPGYREWIQRIHDGAIGDIVMIRALWNGTSRPGKPRLEGESELEYQIRNWYYFTWLSGDHNVEQHVHNLDVANWIMKDAHPVVARGMGGREVRNLPENGQIFDHHFVEYEYADGTLLYSQARQIPNCWRSIRESVAGTLGKASFEAKEFTLSGPKADTLRFRQGEDGHQLEHFPFFKAIRENLDHNEAERGAMATMTGILGRMANYSGQEVRWDDAMASSQKLVPEGLVDFASPAPVRPDAVGRYPVAVPGVTKPFEIWY
jgi:predicted dehydrogenase